MDLRQLRRHCRQKLSDFELAVPQPFDINALCEGLAQRRGRPIKLRSKFFKPGVSGLWVATDDVDYIYYERNTSTMHQTHIILHEVGHIICGHIGGCAEGDEAIAALAPALASRAVQMILGRTHRTSLREREAEIVAALILQQADQQVELPAPATGPDADVISRIEGSLQRVSRSTS